MSIEPYLDELQRFGDDAFHAELIAARVEYFAGLGQISENEDSFEAHLDRFLDWFLFERKLPQTGQTPVQTYIEQKSNSLGPDDMLIYEGFSKNIHSLFQVRKTDKGGVHLRDLFTKAKYYIEEDVPHAFTKGQTFEARLIPYKNSWRFSRGYIFHPLSATKIINKRVKKISIEDEESQKALIRDLAIRRLKADRYKHIDALEFYKT